SYVVDGGSAAERSQVRAALEASSFDWGLIPQTIQVHVAPGGESYSTPGQVYVSASLLDAGRFAWATVQHEMGHQVDFFLLDDATRVSLADNPLAECLGHRLGARVGVELVHRLADVRAHRLRGDVEALPDLLVGVTVREQPQHVALALGELRHRLARDGRKRA